MHNRNDDYHFNSTLSCFCFFSLQREFTKKDFHSTSWPNFANYNYNNDSIILLYFADQVQSFLGNQTHRDYFKLLSTDGVSLLIGARNVVYNLSLADLTENEDQVSHYHYYSDFFTNWFLDTWLLCLLHSEAEWRLVCR